MQLSIHLQVLFIFRFDVHIVKISADTQFDKIIATSEFEDKSRDQREQIFVFYYYYIEDPVILYQME